MATRKTNRSSRGRGARGSARRASAHGQQAADQQRTVIAQQAARLVLDQGIRDYGVAKRKAAERLGAVSAALLPSNREVEQAVLEHRRLFGGSAALDQLHELRKGALEAMRFFSAYAPRLVGAVLSGAVSEHTPITLHLHTDTAEDVPRRLLDADMSFDTSDVHLRYLSDRTQRCPRHQFSVDGLDYEVLVLAVDAIREAPASPVDGRPERRASLSEVEALVAKPPEPPADLPVAD
ncbi:MAG: hypothetical protein AAGA68_04120 [Pseudomonadota bacterium]